jgi:hypothetical protein
MSKHPIVGYYGAIADWFDVELMADLARKGRIINSCSSAARLT